MRSGTSSRPGRTVSASDSGRGTIALVGVVVGLPVGVAVGRRLWSLIADRTRVVDLPVISFASPASATGATLVSVAILSLLLALSDARHHPTDALRVE